MNYRYINEEQIDTELKCTICDEPFQAPMNCNLCGNTYCQLCISKWMQIQLSCPSCRQTEVRFEPVISRAIVNQLNRLLVQCQLCLETDIQRSNFTDHLSCTCPKQTVNCTNNCGWEGFREALEFHLKECRQDQMYGIDTFQWWRTGLILILAISIYLMFQRSENTK